jgi:hypothetical protein
MSYLYSTLLSLLLFIGIYTSFIKLKNKLDCHRLRTQKDIYTALSKTSDNAKNIRNIISFAPGCILTRKAIDLNINGNLKNEKSNG